MSSPKFLTTVLDFSPLPPLRTPAPGITLDTTTKYNIFYSQNNNFSAPLFSRHSALTSHLSAALTDHAPYYR